MKSFEIREVNSQTVNTVEKQLLIMGRWTA